MNKKCVYCWKNEGNTDDHVFARQFFPKEEKFRGNLPKVPSCRICNGNKQKLEDIIGILLQFGHDSEGSEKVLNERGPSTLDENQKLKRKLQNAFQEIKLNQERRLAFDLSEFEEDLYGWLNFIFKGIAHYFSKKVTEEEGLKMTLLRFKNQVQVDHYLGIIRSTVNFKEEKFANNEIHLFFAENPQENLVLMCINFKSVTVFCLLFKEESPAIKNLIKESSWDPQLGEHQ